MTFQDPRPARGPLQPQDLEQLRAHGLDAEEAVRQLQLLRRGSAGRRLQRACRVGDGIDRWSEEEALRFEGRGREVAADGRLSLFVPASGAATRMFEPIAWAAEAATWSLADLDRRALAGEAGAAAVLRFWAARERLPFWPRWRSAAEAAGIDLSAAGGATIRAALAVLLSPAGLGYSGRPKGLIPFHGSDFQEGGARSALAEQILDAFDLVRDRAGRVRVHATVASEFEVEFRAEAERWASRLDGQLELTLSCQAPSTDTLALDEHGLPARESDGRLVLRPGGHGALLDNLARSPADLVLVRNIDNVQSVAHREASRRWRRRIAGCLAHLQGQAFELLDGLASGPSDATLEAAEQLSRAAFGVAASWPREREARRQALVRTLDRPIRVCGMVPHAGEPGGGPFWVEEVEGSGWRQIVEGAEVVHGRPEQRGVWQSSTHFNPVDLAIGQRDRANRPYDLARFRDPGAVLVTDKVHGGRRLRALEHPGLWNGSMARWLTVFVEIPAAVFSPVKTVLDLLRPEHQTESELRPKHS